MNVVVTQTSLSWKSGCQNEFGNLDGTSKYVACEVIHRYTCICGHTRGWPAVPQTCIHLITHLITVSSYYTTEDSVPGREGGRGRVWQSVCWTHPCVLCVMLRLDDNTRCDRDVNRMVWEMACV